VGRRRTSLLGRKTCLYIIGLDSHSPAPFPFCSVDCPLTHFHSCLCRKSDHAHRSIILAFFQQDTAHVYTLEYSLTLRYVLATLYWLRSDLKRTQSIHACSDLTFTSKVRGFISSALTYFRGLVSTPDVFSQLIAYARHIERSKKKAFSLHTLCSLVDMVEDGTNAFNYVLIRSGFLPSYVSFKRLFLTYNSIVNNITQNLAVAGTHCRSRVSDTRLTKV
jgi:hypothetical protein